MPKIGNSLELRPIKRRKKPDKISSRRKKNESVSVSAVIVPLSFSVSFHEMRRSTSPTLTQMDKNTSIPPQILSFLPFIIFPI